MKFLIFIPIYTFLLFNYANAQVFTYHNQLASAFSNIFGINSNKNNPFNKKNEVISTKVRIIPQKNTNMKLTPDEADDKKLLMLESQNERHERLLIEAQKKKALAKKILSAIDKAGASITEENNLTMMEDHDKSDQLRHEIQFNTSHAKLLIKQAELMESEAAEIQEMIKSVKLSASEDPSKNECEIVKVGPLKFVTKPDDIRGFINSDTTGQVSGKAISIFYKKQPKYTFFWEGIEPFANGVADAPDCFQIKYNGMPQLLCASSKEERNSWINAISEAWFCVNTGIRGTLPSIKAAENEVEKLAKFPKAPLEKEDKNKPKGLINIEIGVGDDLKPIVKVNDEIAKNT